MRRAREGKFATVRRAVHKKTGVHFAAKFLRRRRRAQCTLKEIGHEIAILMMCADSKHIVKLNSVHETKSETALILELATGGELQAILDDERVLTEAQAQICMREILKALQYLHKKYIAHLDIKPQNILLCGDKVEDGLKLCDFGISRIVVDGGKVREILGTADYVAPEVLQFEPLSLKTDIWSVGVLTYVLLTGCSPFGGDTKQETFLNISKCLLTFPEELFEDVSPVAIDFIRCALRVKPEDRLSATECLEHCWLSEDLPRLTMPSNAFKDCNDLLDNNFTTIDTSIAHNGTNGVYHNKYNSINESSEETVDADVAVQSNKDYNKENILGNSNHSKYSIQASSMAAVTGVLNGSNTPTTPTAASVPISDYKFEDRNDDLVNPTLSTSTITINPCEMNRHQSSLFPDAPTTPKVCRKSSPDSPPSVKALVKKFQLENSDAISTSSTNGTNGHGDTDGTACEEDFCSARCSVNCMPCGPGCRHLNGRKSIGIDQGIIC
ncbi:hypothetical protein HA402_002382 [Bradysia odoriphaga]|nr:hypothetical protein HA402_002382 [Bradysia odoriphaga]